MRVFYYIYMYEPKKSLKELIEEEINVIDIYAYYTGIPIKKLPISCKSPLRTDDHPSFGIYISKGKVYWKDFALQKGGDVYALVCEIFNISFSESLKKIYNDLSVKTTSNNISLLQNDSNIILQPYFYLNENIPSSYYEYWSKYKVITPEILNKNYVRCVKYAFMNYNLAHEYRDDNIIIGYTWNRKGKIYYKLYFPFNKEHRFISNFRGVSRYLIHGLNTMDLSQPYIIITKSVKDKMVLEGLNYNAISVQNEGIQIPENIIKQLKLYYSTIYLLYDNDYNKKENWGQLAAKKLVKEHGLTNIKIDGRYKVSDISDYIEKYDITQTKEFLKKYVN